MNRNKTILFNIASTIILQGLAFVSGPIFSSVLGTDNYGIASVYLTWVTIASTVLSLQAAGTVAVARTNFPMDEQPQYQSSVLSLATISYIGFAVMVIVGSLIASLKMDISLPMILVGLMHGWGLYVVGFMNLKLTYEFKADKNFLLSIIVSTCTIGLSLILIHQLPSKTNYWGRIIGQSAVYTFVGLILFIHVVHSGKTIFNKTYWSFTLPIALPTIFHLLANIILNQSDRVMLSAMVSNSATGIYALAWTFGTVLNTIWSALNNSWVPFYYEYTRQGSIDKVKTHARNYIELFTIVTMGFILLSREVFHIYANPSFWEGTDLLPLFSIGYYFVFLYSFPVNYEFYHKNTRVIAIGTTFAALLNIALNFCFIQLWSIQGAVIATAVSHGLQFCFHFISAKRINPGEFPFRITHFIPGLTAVCGTCVLYWLSRDAWVIRWIFALIIGVYILFKMFRRREIF